MQPESIGDEGHSIPITGIASTSKTLRCFVRIEEYIKEMPSPDARRVSGAMTALKGKIKKSLSLEEREEIDHAISEEFEAWIKAEKKTKPDISLELFMENGGQ